MFVVGKSFAFSAKINKHLTKYGKLEIGNRKKSFDSHNWIKRHQADPYVELAKKENYRCRSAFKLIEMCKKYNLVKPGFKVLDLGAAPGSWSQVLADKTNSNCKDENSPIGLVIAVDLSTILPINGVCTLSQCDFTQKSSQNEVLKILGPNEKFDFIFSDMAPPATGIKALDQDKIINLIYPVVLFAVHNLKEGGGCLIKVWNFMTNNAMKDEIIKFFSYWKFVKPQASYKSSSEVYLLLREFLGIKI